MMSCEFSCCGVIEPKSAVDAWLASLAFASKEYWRCTPLALRLCNLVSVEEGKHTDADMHFGLFGKNWQVETGLRGWSLNADPTM
eukprot:12047829-Karenia_brevis.AAC.1